MGFIPGFIDTYPYTDFHELNLDFLLNKYGEIINNLNNINTWIKNHEIDYEDAIRRLTAVENEINTFEAQVMQMFAAEQRKIDASIASMDEKVDAKIAEFEREFNEALDAFRREFNALVTRVTAEINQLKVEINRAIINLNNQIKSNNEYIFDYVENTLEEFIKTLPTLDEMFVYNPTRGTETSLQAALNDLYDVSRVYGLTALQYDSLGLTASEYDAKELTANEYDRYGYIKLGYPDENWYMISPFTGQVVKVKDVVMDLAHLHMEYGLTASEYDALQLTATEYDEKEITAFNYDWYGKQILTA